MIVIDLTPAFIDSCLHRGDPAAYERSDPALFDHYFTYWSRRTPYALSAEFDVEERAKRIRSRLPFIEQALATVGVDSASTEIALFVGTGASNGHAYFTGKVFRAWIPVEAYTSIESIDVFVTHELIHAVHYSRESTLYFHTELERRTVARQLITEGAATYVTMRALNCSSSAALWADVLPGTQSQEWLAACGAQRSTLARRAVETYREEDRHGLFEMRDPTDALRYRSGYFLALTVVESIADEFNGDCSRLLSIPRHEMEVMVLERLTQMR